MSFPHAAAATATTNAMFTDENLDQVNLDSTWSQDRDCVDAGNQMKPLSVKDSESQSNLKVESGSQTTNNSAVPMVIMKDDSPQLAAFLKKMEPLVYKELDKNARSQAFQGYQVSWQDESSSVNKLHVFTHDALRGQCQVTGLSWNSSGSVIAASFGRLDHDSWCTHKSALCTWNIDSQTLDSKKASKVIEQSCCLMCVAFHPANPALVCAGNFNGEIMLWDFSHDNVLLVDSYGMGDGDAHREPVAKLQWVLDPESHSKTYKLVSVSGDGKLLVWTVDMKLNKLTLTQQFAVTSQSLPKSLRGKGSRSDREVGLTCLSYTHYGDHVCFIGSETGAIFKCCTQQDGHQGVDMDGKPMLPSPVVFTYKPHLGPVNAIDCSPFHPHAFLTTGMDQSMKIWNALQSEPVKVLKPDQGSLVCGSWSPVRPLVIAAATDTGLLLLYDLQHSMLKPLHTLEAGTQKAPIYSCSFNTQRPNIIASGDGEGDVHIFQLNDDLVQAGVKEKDLLAAILSLSE
ncbi:cytoplasmic dynein 2 intermediate chain 2-like [Octopus vulgaris]|uniref:Cytoplasmic dynein 2 intermediate chain 2-like n=1 Tax=Octopus vulgaris TaxID=6645 RepID=A0AA36BVJ5_OCTVU|nr:cytoplasmic dynein 2 intermediate chain 2-like [Octopus vulgaris]